MTPRSKLTVGAAVLATAAGIVLAGPSDATPGQDGLFLHTLGQLGISYDSADFAIAHGLNVCRELDHGMTIGEVAFDVWVATDLGITNAQKFTAAAVAVYCSWRMPAPIPAAVTA